MWKHIRCTSPLVHVSARAENSITITWVFSACLGGLKLAQTELEFSAQVEFQLGQKLYKGNHKLLIRRMFSESGVEVSARAETPAWPSEQIPQ